MTAESVPESAAREFVERKRPATCPICGHADRCKSHRQHGDDLIICFRIADETVNGFHRLKKTGECCTYIRAGSPADRNGKAEHSLNGKPERTPHARWVKCREKATAATLANICVELGVSAEALKSIGTGFDGKHPVFPEKDAKGNIVGLSSRDPKRTPKYRVGKGDRRGLIVPENLAELPDPVLSVEGPTCTAAALTMGSCAVGRFNNSGGTAELAKLLAGREVIVVGENDRNPDGSWPGRDGAVKVARELASAWNTSVRWALPPTMTDGKDCRDFLLANRDRDSIEVGRELLRHLEATATVEAPQRASPKSAPAPSGDGERLAITLASDVEPEIVTWTWPSRIPCGKLSVITGDPEAGKTFLGVDIAARISTGTSWPDCCNEPNPVGDVIMLTAEDGLADTIVPRLIEAGADLNRIRIVQGIRMTADDSNPRPFNLDNDLRHLDDEIVKHPETRIVLVDPIGSYFGAAKCSYKDADVRAVLGPVAVMAERRKVPVVCLGHLNKQSTNSKALYRMLGSIAFVGLPRAAWLVVRDKNEPTERLLLRVKSNLAPDPGGLRFTIAGQPTGRVHWHDGIVNTLADDALREPSEAKAKPVGEATEWLTRQLADGPVPSATILKRADEKGFAERTLNRAKARLGVESKRLAPAEGAKKVSHWVLPGKDDDIAKPTP